MNELFIEKLLNVINLTFKTYYEEPPKDVTFPFGVVPTITFMPLNDGYQAVFDIEIYNNELSNQSIEKICDNLRKSLDQYSYLDDKIGFHLGFESLILSRQSEQDLTYRRISFIARIFDKKGE